MHDLFIYETKSHRKTKEIIFQGSERKYQLLTSDTFIVLSTRWLFKYIQYDTPMRFDPFGLFDLFVSTLYIV